MGINERDYYRKEAPSFLGSSDDQGKATTWLIGLTVACFVIQMMTRPASGRDVLHGPLTDWFALDVPLVWRGQVWRLLTYGFLHDDRGVYHILFNMLGLWWFGRQIEDRLGTREFLSLYLCAMAFSGATYMVTAATGFHRPALVVGASGAIATVLMLTALWYPQQVVYLFLILPVPVWFIVVMMIATDGYALIDGFSRPNARSTGVASAAHLGGLLFGFLYDRLNIRLSDYLRWPRLRARPRLRVYNPESEEPRRPSRLQDEHLEAQVDAILEKVGRVGMAGLTDREREVLMKASEAIRRRDA